MEQAPSPRPFESPWLDDQFVESYGRWREESGTVRQAYERWLSAERQDRTPAWDAYQVALDREEHAARAHQACAARIAAR